MRVIFCFLMLFVFSDINSQTNEDMELPYKQILEYPEDYSPGNVVSRMIDGLGYRYYWATESLRDIDLEFRPSEDARTAFETLEHIHGLSQTVLNTIKNEPNIRSADRPQMSFDEMRKKTLLSIKKASDLVRGKTDEELSELAIIFQRGDNRNEFPFWHILNGPLADAIYHTGQIVSFRRTSGNPQNSKVSVFRGKNRN